MSAESMTVWGMVAPPLHNELAELVGFGVQQGWTPDFEPHCTIVGSWTAEPDQFIAQVKAVAPQFSALPIELGEVGISTTYFQNVFVRVMTTAALMELHLAIKTALLDTREYFFMPHISLVYGNQAPSQRQTMATELKPKLKITSGWLDRLVITPSTPDPASWHHLAEIKLGQPDS